MQGKQLKQTEELYLYLFELNKEMKALKHENEELRKLVMKSK